MPEGFQYRRAPALLRKINEINPESDIRVRILGKVIDKSDGAIIVDDGSGKIEIITEDIQADVNDIVRIFARVLPLEEGFELRAELIQHMNALDLNLYRKIMY
jgi:hypothetical protein